MSLDSLDTYTNIDAPKNHTIKHIRTASVTVYLTVVNSEEITPNSFGGASFSESCLKSRVVIVCALSA